MISLIFIANNSQAFANSNELAKQMKELDYFKKQGHNINIGLVSRTIAEIYDKQKNYDEAIKYYEQSNYYLTLGGEPDWGVQYIQRANEIRSDIRLYVETKVELGRPLAKYEPVSGTYLGFYAGGQLDKDYGEDDFFTNLGNTYNRQHAMYLTYAHWTNGGIRFPTLHAERLKGSNKALQIALEPLDGLDMIKDGPAIREFARQANEAGIPIFIRFAGEMNGDWVPWYDTTGKKYIEKFRLVHDIFEQEAPNVAFVWAPNFYPYWNTEMYYPGDQYVDWVGVSLYMHPYSNNKEILANNPFQYLDTFTTLYPNKPLMYVEGGVSNYSFINNKDYSDWAKIQLNYMLKYAPKMYPQLKAITYFNQDMTELTQAHLSKDNNYDLAANTEVFNTFKQIVKDPFLIDQVKFEMNNSVMTEYKQISNLREGSGTHNAFVYAKLPEGQIAHYVAVFQNDKKIADSYSVPFEIKLNLSALDQNKPVRVVAYDSNWKEISAKMLNVNYKKVNTLSNFSDLNEGHWAFKSINAAVQQGTLNGYNGKFRPDDNISVQEFVTILARIYGKADEVSSKGGYQKNVVQFMKSLNLPYSNQPELQLTRTQVAEMIAASQGYNYSGDNAIKYLLVNGFSKGKLAEISVKNYFGSEKLTRAEAVTFLANIKNVGSATIQKRPTQSSDTSSIQSQYSTKFE